MCCAAKEKSFLFLLFLGLRFEWIKNFAISKAGRDFHLSLFILSRCCSRMMMNFACLFQCRCCCIVTIHYEWNWAEKKEPSLIQFLTSHNFYDWSNLRMFPLLLLLLLTVIFLSSIYPPAKLYTWNRKKTCGRTVQKRHQNSNNSSSSKISIHIGAVFIFLVKEHRSNLRLPFLIRVWQEYFLSRMWGWERRLTGNGCNYQLHFRSLALVFGSLIWAINYEYWGMWVIFVHSHINFLNEILQF